jgi:uncharacterized protein (TIGR00369 family)
VNGVAAPVDDGHCVGCGPHSPIGLRMQFARNDDGSVVSRIVVPQAFQGWQGIVHGGIVALMLDEAMAYAAAANGALGMTAELNMRFRSEVRVGDELIVHGSVLWQRRTILAVQARIVTASDDALLASAEGKFVSRGSVEPGTRLGFMRNERAGG